MSKITVDGLTRSGIGLECFIAVPTTHTATVGVKGLMFSSVTGERLANNCIFVYKNFDVNKMIVSLLHQHRVHSSIKQICDITKTHRESVFGLLNNN